MALREYQPFPNESKRNNRQVNIEIPTMLWALGAASGGRILEVGCGRGVALPEVNRRLLPSKLVGLDIDQTLLDEASETCAEAELVAGDVRELPFADGSFDLVIDFGTLYHITRPENGLTEIARVLAPGGVFVHETPLSQLLSHPRRWDKRPLPWSAVRETLRPARHALLWASRSRKR